MEKKTLILNGTQRDALESNLKRWLAENQRTQKDLADAAGLNVQTVWKIINGKQNVVRITTLELIAEKMGTDVQGLFSTPQTEAAKIEALVGDIRRLKEDPDVILAMTERTHRERLREMLAELKTLKKQGERLRSAGVTMADFRGMEDEE